MSDHAGTLGSPRTREPRGFLRTARAVFVALRFQYVMFELSPFILGTALAWAEAGAFDLGLAAAMAVTAVAIGQASEPFNEYFDARRGADSFEKQTILSGGSGVLEAGLLRPRDLMTVALTTLAIGCVTGTALSIYEPLLFPLGVGGVVLAVIYSVPPFRLRYRGLGELAMGIGKGSIVVWAAYIVQAHALSWQAVVLGVGYAFVVASFMHVKVYGRLDSDREVGKVTLLYLSGRRLGIWLYLGMFVVAYASVVLAAAAFGTGWWTLICFALAPLLASILGRLVRDPEQRDQAEFKILMREVLVLTNLFPVLVAIGLLLG